MASPDSIHSQLAQAIEDGQAATVSKLLAEYPELAEPASWTPPPLHCTVLWNQPTIAIIFLEAGANIDRLDPDRQTTPLRYAVMYAKLEMVRLLISRGANTEAIRAGGTNVFQLAVECQDGKYEQFEDLPAREVYPPVVELLKELGLEHSES